MSAIFHQNISKDSVISWLSKIKVGPGVIIHKNGISWATEKVGDL